MVSDLDTLVSREYKVIGAFFKDPGTFKVRRFERTHIIGGTEGMEKSVYYIFTIGENTLRYDFLVNHGPCLIFCNTTTHLENYVKMTQVHCGDTVGWEFIRYKNGRVVNNWVLERK